LFFSSGVRFARVPWAKTVFFCPVLFLAYFRTLSNASPSPCDRHRCGVAPSSPCFHPCQIYQNRSSPPPFLSQTDFVLPTILSVFSRGTRFLGSPLSEVLFTPHVFSRLFFSNVRWNPGFFLFLKSSDSTIPQGYTQTQAPPSKL